MPRVIAVAALILILGLVNWSIYSTEKHLAQGEIVYLKLAPVDPRSLMQGDYMALRFQVADKIAKALPFTRGAGRSRNQAASDGLVVVSLNGWRIGFFKALYVEQPLSENDILLQYRVRNGTVRFATNAFFFPEGQGEVYEKAEYGQFRVNDKGEVLLAGLYDAELKKLGPEKE